MAQTLTTDPGVLSGWGARGYNWEYTISGQHELAPRVSVAGGWYRRKYGNQTVTVDNRYSMAKGSYDGPFCLNTPPDPNLPGGGAYQVCGLYDLKPAVATAPLPQSSTLSFSSNYGGETNIFEGFDASITARPKPGFFLNAGITAGKRVFDQCALVDYGVLSFLTSNPALLQQEISERYPNGDRACHQDLPYRPDFKLLGAYTLPYDIALSGTFQFTRGLQTGGAAPSLLAQWAASTGSTTLGRPYANSAATRTWNLIEVGENYGNYNLKQLDLRASKRFRISQYRLRFDFDAYNIFNSNWPYTLTSTFSTLASSQWMRPTNVLQSRFFKLGINFDF